MMPTTWNTSNSLALYSRVLLFDLSYCHYFPYYSVYTHPKAVPSSANPVWVPMAVHLSSSLTPNDARKPVERSTMNLYSVVMSVHQYSPSNKNLKHDYFPITLSIYLPGL